LKVDKITVFRTHRFGDILQTIPMLKGLREKFPNGYIYFIVDRSYQELVEKSQLVHEVIPINYTELNNRFSDKNVNVNLVKDYYHNEIKYLKSQHIDLFINRSYSNASALFGTAIEPKQSLGKQFQPIQGFFYDPIAAHYMNTIVSNRKNNIIHLVDFGCQLAAVEPSTRELQFNPNKEDHEWWRQQTETYNFGETDWLIALQLGANKPFRQWECEKYSQLIENVSVLLESNGINCKLLIVGQNQEHPLFQLLKVQLKNHHQVVNFMGKTSFGQLAILLANCKFLLTGDTGTMHLATAVKTPALAIFFASAYYKETGPYGQGNYVISPEMDCYPCFNPETCPYNLKCRQLISVNAVVKAISILLSISQAKEWCFKNLNLWYTGDSAIVKNIHYDAVNPVITKL
jgi:ADP-heptose:LPS heptosyltransferase